MVTPDVLVADVVLPGEEVAFRVYMVVAAPVIHGFVDHAHNVIIESTARKELLQTRQLPKELCFGSEIAAAADTAEVAAEEELAGEVGKDSFW